jgi:hypothetical protein
VSNNLEGIDQDSIGRCSVCGGVTKLVELPGRIDKFCLECSGDVATAILLITEIDAATLSGGNTDALVSEFTQISSRILERAQSAQWGFSRMPYVPIFLSDYVAALTKSL